MLTRPLNDSDDRGRDLAAVTPPPRLPLADGVDDNKQTGVFSPSAPPWSSSSPSSSSSSSPSPPPPPRLCVLSSSSAPPLTPPPTVLFSPSSFSSSSLSAPPPPPFTPLPPRVFFAPCTPPSSSTFSPFPSSSPLVPPSLLSLPPSPLSVSSPPFISPPPPPLSSSSSSSLPAPSYVSSPSSSRFPSLSSFLHPSPPHSASVSFTPSAPPPPPSFTHNVSAICSPPSSSPLVPPSHHSPPLNPPPPVSPPPLSSPPLPVPPPPLSSPPLPVPPSPLSSPPLSVAPSPLPPPPPPPCCSCSSLLPRLLSAHRLEVRRLLRGALSSLGRRLDSLERKTRMKRRKKRSRQRGEEGGAARLASFHSSDVGAFSPAPLHSPAPHSPVTSSCSSSSSDSEDSPPPSSSLSQSEQRKRSGEEEEGRGRKRRRKNHREREITTAPEHSEEEEDSGRFVGRMAVSFRGGAEEEGPLILHKFNHRKHRRREGGGAGQSEKSISVFRQNGFRASLHSSSSQHALHFLHPAHTGLTSSQSEALNISSGQWRFSNLTSPLSLSSNHDSFHIWRLCSSSSSFSSASMLQLSSVAVETMSELVRRTSCGSVPWCLKDWTAPPSLSSDHCYMRTSSPSPAFSPRQQPKQRANHSSRSLSQRRPLPLCSANGLPAPLAISQSEADPEFLSTHGERCKRVSQIRIRRASPRETLLTPMGLPKVKRLKKKEFSLEEIYTNKNYKSPTTNRSLETIFEEPREKDGALLLIGQQRRRRLLLFPDFTQPRKRKRPQGVGLPVAMLPRKRAAARRHCHGGSPGDDDSDLDVMLVERLSALEDFLTRQGLEV